MRGLLDTQALLWFLDGDETLSLKAREFIEDGTNEVVVSVATLWEIAIKHSLGKLDLVVPFEELFPAQLQTNAIAVVPIEVPHLTRLVALPFHHRDPFDRLIISQALVEGFRVIGSDAHFDKYGVDRLW